MKVEIGDKTFEVEKLSGYKLLKVIGDGNKDHADIIRDLIQMAVKEPTLTKEEIEGLEPEIFFKLGTKIVDLHSKDLKNLQNLTK